MLEEQEGSVNFKFGVIYAKKGQTTDDEMLSNGKSMKSYLNFRDFNDFRFHLKNETQLPLSYLRSLYPPLFLVFVSTEILSNVEILSVKNFNFTIS